MIFTLAKANVAQRVDKIPDWRRIIIQINAPFTLRIGSSQDEAQNVSTNDGIQLSQASTSGNNQPYSEWWKGELWISANVDNASFVYVITSRSFAP